ncbi:MAG: efflux RND transporter periplasmic adaptor subunit [Vicinamibacterales bacterium]
MCRSWVVVGAIVLTGAAWGCSPAGQPSSPPSDAERGVRAGARGGQGRGALGSPGTAAGDAARGGRRRGRNWGSAIVRLSPEQERSLGVETMTVAARPFRTTLRAMGEVAVPLPRKAMVSCAFPARIARIHAEVGTWVTRGQPVVTLQSDDVGLAKTEYQKAQASLDLARRSFEREKRLFDNGVGAQKTFFAMESELKVAEATRLAAERRLHVFGVTDEEIRGLADNHGSPAELTLRSPIDGRVVASSAVLGAMVDASREILTVVDTRVLWVDAEIYERDIAQVRLGQTAAIRVPAYPDEVFEGTVNYIGDVVRPETRTIAVRTEVPNRDQRLKPGMFANVVFQIGERPSVVALPAHAILDDTDGHLVFVRTAAGFEPRLVELGSQDNGNREVLGGVTAGEVVVTGGHYQLKSKLYEEALKGGHTH